MSTSMTLFCLLGEVLGLSDHHYSTHLTLVE